MVPESVSHCGRPGFGVIEYQPVLGIRIFLRISAGLSLVPLKTGVSAGCQDGSLLAML